MKNLFFLAAVLFIAATLHAQSDYKVVFDLTSKDSLDQRVVVRWVNEVAHASADAKVEVVMYGQGFNLVKNNSAYAEAVTKLAENKNVSFKVCAVALKSNNVDKSQLLPCVEVVPDGIYEIISKQRQGWGYIKAVH